MEKRYDYKEGRVIGLVIQVLLGLYCCVCAIETLSAFPTMHYAVEKDLETTKIMVDGARAIERLEFLLFTVTGILFIIWLRRMRNNLLAMGITDLSSRPWQVIWSWLIPIYFLWKPFTVSMEIWKASDPLSLQPGSWREVKPSPLLIAWWTFFLMHHVLNKLGNAVVSIGEKDFLSSASILGLEMLITGPATIAAAILAIFVVYSLNSRQERKRMALLSVHQDERG